MRWMHPHLGAIEVPRMLGALNIGGERDAPGLGRVLEGVDSTNAKVDVLIARVGGAPEARAQRTAELFAQVARWKALDHPGVLRVVDAGPLGDALVFAGVERIEGMTLAQKIAHAPFGDEAMIALSLQLASTMADLHAQQLFVRELEPSQVLLALSGRVFTSALLTSAIAELEAAGAVARGDELADQRALGHVLAKTWNGTTSLRAIIARMISDEPYPSMLECAAAIRALEQSFPAIDGIDGERTTVDPPRVPAETVALPQIIATNDFSDPTTAQSKLPPVSPRPQPKVHTSPPPLFDDPKPLPRATSSPKPQPQPQPQAQPLARIGSTPKPPAPAPAPAPVQIPPPAPENAAPASAPPVEPRRTPPRLLDGAFGIGLGLALGVALMTALDPAGPRVVQPSDPMFASALLAIPLPATAKEPSYTYEGDGAPAAKTIDAAREILDRARTQLEERDIARAERNLGLCIEMADLPECHLALGLVLALKGEGTARAHLERYASTAPDASAAAVRAMLAQ